MARIGEQDDAVVVSYAIFASPASVFTPVGQLWRKDVKVIPNGFANYRVEVSYEQKKHTTGDWTFSFDTTGATFNIKIAREHLNSDFAPGVSESDVLGHHGAIGVKEDGDCEGADIVVPALKLTVTYRAAVGIISMAYMKLLAGATGCTNSNPFIGFDAGELLFLVRHGRRRYECRDRGKLSIRRLEKPDRADLQ